MSDPTTAPRSADDDLATALALLDEWEATPEHGEAQLLARYTQVERHLHTIFARRPAQLDAALIPLA